MKLSNLRIPAFLKNKYGITILAFIVWMMFFDRNDVISQYTSRKKLTLLERDKKYYLQEIARSKKDMEELLTNPKNLEKFAREKYYMKRDNEDVFVVVKQ